MPNFSPGVTGTDEVLFRRHGAVGQVRLNRPKAINSLSVAMVTAIEQQLLAWADDDRVRSVFIDGAGDRGLCAGGDVRAVREEVLATGSPGPFFETEYRMNLLISDHPKPVVSAMHGITMGGGIGLGGHAGLRLVTETSQLAMPETVIGFFPDVGARRLLARAPGEYGTWLALTGSAIDGPDAITLGLADTLVREGGLGEIVDDLANEVPVGEDVGNPAPRASLRAHRGWIDECFAGDDAEQICLRLAEHADPAAREAARTIRERSPFAVAVTLAALRKAERAESLAEILADDLTIATAMTTHPDFAEGVRAQLVDKDRNPRWADASLAEVDPEQVAAVVG
ncbi:MAG: enoyl-CoA hydratase/isomerase family protein [Propionibacterium sp.]|nr:enoyl-CoA hydratase/isomerase family protein [Propionibacterium sp.]